MWDSDVTNDTHIDSIATFLSDSSDSAECTR
jgi:hypothetical protein